MSKHTDPASTAEHLAQAWERGGLKRRDFVRLVAAGVSVTTLGAILAACGGAEATATPPPSAAPAPSAAAPAPSAAASVAASAAPAASAAAASAAPAASAAASTAAASAAPSAAASAAGTAGKFDANGFPTGGKYSTLEAAGKKGGKFIEVVAGDAKTNNSMISTDVPSNDRISLQFNSLLSINPDTGLPFPFLAKEVPTRENGGISQDGLTYTFKLRTGVKWHDGNPFTAKDVEFTYNLMKKPELSSPRTAELNDRVDTITATDDTTVVFKLKKIVAPFLFSNVTGTTYAIAPMHILKDVPVAEVKQHPFSTGDPKASIGTGPFKFKEWVRDDHMTVVKNPNYFLGEPALDEYVFKVVKDQDVVVASLKANESDYGQITPALVEDVAKVQTLSIAKWDTYSFTFYSHQLDATKTTLFQEKAVRQALAYALDRDAMAQAIYVNYAIPAQGTMPVLSFAYAPDKLKVKYTYDPKKAEQLLDDAGWKKGSDGIRAKDGKKLQFTLWTGALSKVFTQLVTVIQQQWKAIGVDATPKVEEWNAFLTRITETHDFEMFLVGFSWGVDPDQTTMWGTDSAKGGFNMGKYSNTKVDELLKQGLSELDNEKRKALYVDMQNILMDELPNNVLFFTQGIAALNKRAKNFFPNATNIRWNSHTFWVTDGK